MAKEIPHTHNEHVQTWLDRIKGKNSEGTYKKRKGDLKNFEIWLANNDKDILSANLFTIENYLFNMSSEGFANSTISGRYSSISLFYDFLANKIKVTKEIDGETKKVPVIDESPCKDFSRKEHGAILNGTKKVKETKEEITYFSLEQIDELCDHAGGGGMNLRNRLLIRLAFRTGLRVGELMDIELSDIDREEREIKIWAEKTHNNRTVYYQSALDTLLTLWIKRRNAYMSASDSDYLFISKKAPQLTREGANQIVVRAADNAPDIDQKDMYVDMLGYGRNKFTIHSLRHSHAIESIKSGIDIRRVQKHMGHANLETTMKYLRFISSDTKLAYKRFGTRDN